MSRRDQPLYRDPADKKIGGVCSGLARYFDVDPLLMRVAMVAGIFVSGVSLIVYPLLWWLMKPAPAADTFAPPTVATTDDAIPGQQAA